MVELFGGQFFEEVVKPVADRCLSGEEVECQALFDFSAAKSRSMEIHYYPHRNDKDEIVGLIVNRRDITDQRQAAQLASFRDARAERVLETALDAFIQIDAEGLLREWNKRAEIIFG